MWMAVSVTTLKMITKMKSNRKHQTLRSYSSSWWVRLMWECRRHQDNTLHNWGCLNDFFRSITTADFDFRNLPAICMKRQCILHLTDVEFLTGAGPPGHAWTWGKKIKAGDRQSKGLWCKVSETWRGKKIKGLKLEGATRCRVMDGELRFKASWWRTRFS